MKILKLNNKAFTIVETLIVLAIAAIIIIIVLLAVPALQRTTRNTDIKNDAGALAAAFNDFESNNGGSLPGTGTITTAGAQATSAVSPVSNGSVPTGVSTKGLVFLCTAPGTAGSSNDGVAPTCGASGASGQTSGAQATVQASDTIWLNFAYSAGTGSSVGTSPAFGTSGGQNTVASGNIVIWEYAVCPSTTGPINPGTNLTYSGNQVAIFYPQETGSGTGNVQCIQG